MSAVPYRAFRRNLTLSYFAPFIVALALLAAIVLWRIQDQASIAGWVEHSDQVLLGTKDAELDLRDMQVAYRNYLLEPDDQYLGRLADARAALAKDIGEIGALVSDNPDQEQRVLKISELKEVWTTGIEQLIAQRKNQPSAEIPPQIHTQAKTVFNALEDFVAVEQRLRVQRVTRQRAEHDILFVLIPILSALVMAVLSYWGWRQIQQGSEQFRAALDGAERARAEAEKASVRAEKANRAKDNFLGTVSHELRNPLNSILLWSTALLRDQGLSENSRKGITAIERAVRVQGQLIEDLLDISRIESGRLRLDVQTVDLAEVVKAAVESMRVAAEAKSIRLQEILDPRVDAIAGDPGRLQQIVWNLVSNAVKFTPKGGTIQLRLERINSHVEIIVADSGRGIEPASLAAVFERFWQEEDAAQNRHGVGLGLSIVKELVSLHGGTVVAHSEGIGKGSTFTVRLPSPASTAPRSDLRRHPTAPLVENTAGALRLDGLSILVVDDDQDTCDGLKRLLGSVGATVTAVTSARKALAILDSQHPDAIVSDIGMPLEDGYFLARELRRREQATGSEGRRLLIALTAYGRVEDKVQILTAGFDGHVIKPVDPAELSALLRTSIDSRRGAPSV